MTKKDLILNKIVGAINETAPDSEVYLYGSRARGNAKNVSDWDLLILLNLPQLSFDLETEIMDTFYNVEMETGEVISPLIYSKNDWFDKHLYSPLFENIEKEGIRLK
jgi:predicted nucleotidyltransferase